MRLSLQTRILSLVAIGVLVMLLVLGVFGFMSVRENTDQILQERLALAQTVAGHLEYVLEENLNSLAGVAFYPGVDLEDNNTEPEKKALHEIYLHSIFSGGLFIVNESGILLLSEPERPQLIIGEDLSGYPHVEESLVSGRPVISGFFTLQPANEPMVSLITPVRKGTRVVGLVIGNIGLPSSALLDIVQPVSVGKTGYVDIIDRQGIVLASSKAERLLQQSDHGNQLASLIQRQETTKGTCHSCHSSGQQEFREEEVLAFFPLSRLLSIAPWGVTVRQPETEALALPRSIQRNFFIFGLSLLGIGVLLSWGMARSIIRPVRVLTGAASKIAGGNLSDSIPSLGRDEIGDLAQSFDAMRRELKASVEKIQEWNKELERTVQERTRELEESRAMRGELLRKIISAQEEERKRIARELHDDTSQALAALAVALDTAAITSSSEAELKAKLTSMKSLTVGTLDNLRQMILDLRPAVLDDLGLLSAIRWYAEGRLKPLGVRVHVGITGTDKRLPPQIEIALFRVVQEAVTNIAKHAEADNVMLEVEFTDSTVVIEIEDDGKGFVPRSLTGSAERSKGLGLLGMKERVSLLGGEFTLDSEPDEGTRVRVEVPLDTERKV